VLDSVTHSKMTALPIVSEELVENRPEESASPIDYVPHDGDKGLSAPKLFKVLKLSVLHSEG